MSGIGHNGGPSLEAGAGFRRVAWQKARAALLPAMPLEVVRMRVARAERLGLPYKTYATIRATTGRDIIGFLFSGHALELRMGEHHVSERAATRLANLQGQAQRLGAVYAPATARALLAANPDLLDTGLQAPDILVGDGACRHHFRTALAAEKLPADAVVVVSATPLEARWSGIAGLAGRIDAQSFFAV